MPTLKLILFFVMIIAFILNFLIPSLLKKKKGDENVSVFEVNSIKLLAFLVVLVCALFIFI